ncbi:MAG: rhomboid family intramembrane serine protease [Chitinophagales bacterium]|nr:rhomboid family intramembrane serine protease [Chitinophagales bacterium]
MANISSNINKRKDERSFYFKLKLSIFIVALWFLVEILDRLFNLNLEVFGLKPKSTMGVLGIFSFPFLHGDWQHLISNSSSALVLFTALFVFHEAKSLKILLLLYLSSGALLWLIGDYGSNHIGASGLIYAVAFFLFVASVIQKDRNSMALSFFIIMLYGSMIWGIMPYFVQENVSWQGHLSGAIVGSVLALYEFRNYKYERPVFREEEKAFFERHPYDSN